MAMANKITHYEKARAGMLDEADPLRYKGLSGESKKRNARHLKKIVLGENHSNGIEFPVRPVRFTNLSVLAGLPVEMESFLQKDRFENLPKRVKIPSKIPFCSPS